MLQMWDYGHREGLRPLALPRPPNFGNRDGSAFPPLLKPPAALTRSPRPQPPGAPSAWVTHQN